jgi:hypothetical protein
VCWRPSHVATILQKISRRVIRTLRRLGYLEADREAPVATGYEPLRDTEPELARALVASVQQRIGGISWSSCYAIPHEAPWRWND